MDNSEIRKCTGKYVKIVCIGESCSLDITSIGINACTLSTPQRQDTPQIDMYIQSARILAPDAEYISICTGEVEAGITSETAVQEAFILCNDLSPQIIVICFTLDNISLKTIELIQSFANIGVFVCAFNDFTVNNSESCKVISAIKQDEHFEFKNKFELIGNTFHISTNIYFDSSVFGNSFALGYFVGHLARVLEFNPLINYDSFTAYYRIRSNDFNYHKNKKPTAFFLIHGQHEIMSYCDMISENYLYYYDNDECCFKDRKTLISVPSNEINEVDIVCGDDFAECKPRILIENSHIRLNHFNNFTGKTLEIEKPSYDLNPISIPSVCIGSYGMNMDKLLIQLYLNRHFAKSDYIVGNISFNPITHLFGYKYIPFTQENDNQHLKQYWYDLNQCFYDEKQNKDVLVVSMAGSFDRFHGDSHRLGDTSYTIANIHSPYIVILSVSNFVEPSEVQKAIKYIHKTIGAKPVIYVSDRNTDDRLNIAGFYNTRLTEAGVEAYCQMLKLYAGVIPFTRKDLENERLFKYVLKLIAKQIKS